jgi:hypothetical protein
VGAAEEGIVACQGPKTARRVTNSVAAWSLKLLLLSWGGYGAEGAACGGARGGESCGSAFVPPSPIP